MTYCKNYTNVTKTQNAQNGTDKTCPMQGCYKHSIKKKNALFAKYNKAKWVKMRHTYLYLKDRYSTKMIFYQ